MSAGFFGAQQFSTSYHQLIQVEDTGLNRMLAPYNSCANANNAIADSLAPCAPARRDARPCQRAGDAVALHIRDHHARVLGILRAVHRGRAARKTRSAHAPFASSYPLTIEDEINRMVEEARRYGMRSNFGCATDVS
ncbi:hypothetical protein A0H81_14681 [Grifola frondosa]|uniref:Uncharacterized protein n=1 Tax=Grifola frondosa TaxID=5627 RepID=A0A1C7LKR0_GRIFR|nr:hypothetical protein A0H81_14681 [Grifola frondosa]